MNPNKKVHFIVDRWGGQRKVTWVDEEQLMNVAA
jgi:preprotein translocase subunit SecE